MNGESARRPAGRGGGVRVARGVAVAAAAVPVTQHPVTWLAKVLHAAGVSVVEHPGWKTRGRPASTGGFAPRAVMWHHDASSDGASPGSPLSILSGRPPTDPGPLAQCWVALDGTWHLLAAGRCNHAGVGPGWGVIPADEGNTYAIGVETDHTVGETWPTLQLDALRVGTAAVLSKLGARPGDALCGHKEYAPGRKPDPDGLNMDAERTRVAGLMDGDDVGWNDELDNRWTGGKSTAGDLLEEIYRQTRIIRAAQNPQAVADAVAAKLAGTTGLTVEQVKQAVKDGITELVTD